MDTLDRCSAGVKALLESFCAAREALYYGTDDDDRRVPKESGKFKCAPAKD